METKNASISLGYGIHRSPSIGNPGELSDCVNLIPKDGEMVNLLPPKDKGIVLNEDEVLMAMHRSNAFNHPHYLVYADKTKEPSRRPIPPLTRPLEYLLTITNSKEGVTFGIEGKKGIDYMGVYPVLKFTFKDSSVFTWQPSEFGGYSFTKDELAEMGWSTDNQIVELAPINESDEWDDEEGNHYSQIYNTRVQMYTGGAPKEVAGVLYWLTEADQTRRVAFEVPLGSTLTKVDCIGNTIVLLLSTGMEYVLFRDGEYITLGNNIPEVSMRFALDGELEFRRAEQLCAVTWGKDEPKEYKELVFPRYPIISGYSGSKGGMQKEPYMVDFAKYDEGGLKITKFRIYNYTDRKIKLVFGRVFKAGSDNKEFWSTKNTITTYKIDANSYKDIELDYQVVGMQMSFADGTPGTVSVGMYKASSTQMGMHASNAPENVDIVLGVAAEFISRVTRKENMFVSPFFVRMAIKLYDGSMIHQSVPCLMIPTSKMQPAVLIRNPGGLDAKASMFTAGMKCDLQYHISSDDIERLKLWKDIVVGVTIAISKPLYLYDQDPEKGEGKYPLTTIARLEDESWLGYTIANIAGNGYAKTYLDEMLPPDSIDEPDDKDGKFWCVQLPKVKDSSPNAKPAEFDNFYQIKSIKLDELVGDEYETVDLTGVDLMNPEARQVLADDTGTHNRVIPYTSYVFNSRLNIGNIKEEMWSGGQMAELQGLELANQSDEEATISTRVILSMVIDNQLITTGDKFFNNQGFMSSEFRWFYYPRRNVSSATVYLKRLNKYYKSELQLTDHPFMRGSYWFNNFAPMQFMECEASEATRQIDTAVEVARNKVYTSQVNNPFSFPEELKNDIADGELIGMSSAVKAISTGQFGQQPLYAFTTTGIWALQPTSSGGWASVQPVSRDVVSDPDSIVQIDNAVAFVTKQGLKLISGGDVKLMSAQIEGFNLSEEFYHEELDDALVEQDNMQFRGMCQMAKLSYDYIHQLIHIFIDGSKANYVLSLETGEFSRQVLPASMGGMKNVVHGYPLTTLQFGQRLYEYDTYTDAEREGTHEGYLMTRIYAFDDPFTRKALMDIRAYGQTTSPLTKFKVYVYVSNDKRNWSKLTSLKMMSAKFYRFLVATSMTDLDTLSGLALTFQERFPRKLR